MGTWIDDIGAMAKRHDIDGLFAAGIADIDYRRFGYIDLSCDRDDVKLSTPEFAGQFSFVQSSDNMVFDVNGRTQYKYQDGKFSISVWCNMHCPECGADWDAMHNRCTAQCHAIAADREAA